MRTRTLVRAAVLAGALLIAGCKQSGLLIRPVSSQEKLTESTVRSDKGVALDKILILDVDGVLVNDRRRGFFADENPVGLFSEKLARAEDDDAVKGVVLRINSPGGGVNASEIMYARLLRFRRERPKVPVVAIIEGVGASGGYYLACAAQEIHAHPTSITGSIGVVSSVLSVAGGLDKIGVTSETITSGPYKAMGNPLEPLDPRHIEVLQGIVDEFYGNFLAVVGKGRPELSAERVRQLADGRVYTGAQALEAGLVDKLGQTPDAIDRVKQLAEIDAAKVVIYHRPYGYRGSIDAASSAPTPHLSLAGLSAEAVMDLMRPRFMYLWTGREGGVTSSAGR